jgi:type II pantothenate kinase
LKLCGVDVGITDTKFAYFCDGDVLFSEHPEFADVTCAYTGAKADGGLIFPEFECAVLGAQKLTGLSDFLLVNMGTGTSFTRVRGDEFTHIGGSGVGGGTVAGLYDFLYRNEQLSVREIASLGAHGNLGNVDLMVSDVLGTGLTETALINSNITAVNLAKLSPDTVREDYAAGIINLVVQTLLMMAVFARRDDEPIVCIGGLAAMPAMRECAKLLGAMHGIRFYFPENSACAGALGCLYKLIKSKETNNDLS